MQKYRVRMGLTTPANPEQSVKKTKTQIGYVNLGLPSRFNVADELNWAGSRTQASSIDEEYRKYVTGTLTEMDINLVKYWEVCEFFSTWGYPTS